MDLNQFIKEKTAEFAREAREPREPMDAAEQWFVGLFHKHMRDALWPMLSAIDRLVTQMVEQINIREQLAQRYLEDNRELRIEVAKLAANVAEMRNAAPSDATQVN
jgi:hypothetical protein